MGDPAPPVAQELIDELRRLLEDSLDQQDRLRAALVEVVSRLPPK